MSSTVYCALKCSVKASPLSIPHDWNVYVFDCDGYLLDVGHYMLHHIAVYFHPRDV